MSIEVRQFEQKTLERRIHRATYYKGNVWTRRPRHRANQNETQETGIVSVETKPKVVPLRPVANVTQAIVFCFRVSLYYSIMEYISGMHGYIFHTYIARRARSEDLGFNCRFHVVEQQNLMVQSVHFHDKAAT